MRNRQRFFSQLYRDSEDPYGHDGARHADRFTTMRAALTRPAYDSALDAGCSVGVFTAMIAPLCRRILGVDISARALVRARTRLCGHGGARFIRAELPTSWPGGTYDLIVLSEVLYFLTPAELRLMAARVAGAAVPGAHCLVVNQTADTCTALSGAAAEEIFFNALGQNRTCVSHRDMSDPRHVITLLTLP